MMGQLKIFIVDHRSIYLNSLGDTLSQMGHLIYYQASWKMNEIEAGIAYFKPDILISIGLDIPLRNASLSRLPEFCRKYNLFHIYWATEDMIQWASWSVPFIRQIQPDLVWTIHPDCVEKYRQLGIEASYLNFAFNPRLFPEKTSYLPEPYDVSFIGTTHLMNYTYRYESFRNLLVPIVQAGQKVNIWGWGWLEDKPLLLQQFGISIPDDWINGYLPYKLTLSVYHQSKIVLGVQNARDQVSQRTFEILGSGAFMIATRTEELQRLFIDREELALSDSPQETVELMRYYLQQPQLRYTIGQKARQKILSQHTYLHRFQEVWPKLEQMLAKKRSGY